MNNHPVAALGKMKVDLVGGLVLGRHSGRLPTFMHGPHMWLDTQANR